MVNLPILRTVDAAEAGGDAYRALALIEADVQRRGDLDTFWHPERVRRLMQLAVYDSVLPGWAISRWILAQAVRSMGASQQQRHTRAFDRTVQVAGGPERYPGVDELDSHCKLMDYDWVYRQLVLYEYGGLRSFVDREASLMLLDRADGIRQWADASMGAFQLVAQDPITLRWLDLTSRREVETANIGSASLVDIGEHAIGRLVPTEAGPMFESAPIFVPHDVATRVAEAPSDWMSALGWGCHREAPPDLRISTRAPGFPLLSDVPIAHQRALVESVVGPHEEALPCSADDLLEAQVAVVRAAMAEEPTFGDLPLEPWPVVGSLVLSPAILVEVTRHLSLEDAVGFDRIARRLASPAAEVCRELALEGGAAAREERGTAAAPRSHRSPCS